VYKQRGYDFEAQWFPVFYLLGREKRGMSMEEIEIELRMPTVTLREVLASMRSHGIIEWEDKISLTSRGDDLLYSVLPLWFDIRNALDEIAFDNDCDTINTIEKLEQALSIEGVDQKALRRISEREFQAIEIRDFRQQDAESYAEINRRALPASQEEEALDRKMNEEPNETVLDIGGDILLAWEDEEPIGCCAMIPVEGKNAYQITKLSTDTSYLGQQGAKKLLIHALNRVSEKGKGSKRVYLELARSDKHIADIAQELGFEKAKASAPSKLYRRSEQRLEFNLAKLEELPVLA
jgi:N-acetylglutamate synthase-like GNAT family acetyltransferase